MYLNMYYITWNQVGNTSCKGHPRIGNLWSTDFSAFHPHECEDASEETSGNRTDSERSAGVEERWEKTGETEIKLKRFVP